MRKLVILCWVACFAGCALGPDFKTPVAPAASVYTAPDLPIQEDAARIVDAPTPKRWWTTFGSTMLNDWVEEGLANSPDLKSADAHLLSAEDLLRAQTGASTLPSVTGDLQGSRQRALGLPDFGPATNLYHVYAGVIQINYDLDLFGLVGRTNEAAGARLQVEAYQFEAARQALIGNIVSTAIDAAALAEEVTVTERVVFLAKRQQAMTEARYAAGAVPHKDVLDAIRVASSAAASLPVLRTRWQRQRHALAILLGRTPDTAPNDLDFSALTIPASVPVSLPSRLVRERPDILAAEAELHAQTAGVGIAKANLFPNITLTGTFGSESFSKAGFLTGQTSVWSLLGGVAQPIFQGGALREQLGAASLEQEAALYRYQNTVLKAFADVGNAMRTLSDERDALAEREMAERSAQRFYNDTRRRYENGSENGLAVVASEELWQQERANAIASIDDRLLATASLYEAIGAPDR